MARVISNLMLKVSWARDRAPCRHLPRKFMVFFLVGIAAVALMAQPAAATPVRTPPSPPSAPTSTSTNTTPSSNISTSPCGVASDGSGAPTLDANSQTIEGATSGIIGQGAITSLCWVLAQIDLGSSPQVSNTADTTTWFGAMYTMFRTIGLWIVMPILMMATIHAIFKGSLFLLLKTFLVYLPVSIVGGVIAVGIVQLLLNATDDFSKGFINSIAANVLNVFGGISDGFGEHGWEEGVPFVISMLMGLLLIFASLGVYVILILREGSVYIATAFFPVLLAFFVWPSTAHFFKKGAEFLFAIIVSKLIMVAGISLAVAAMVSSLNLPSNSSTNVDGSSVNDSVAAGTGSPSDDESWLTWLGQTMTTTVMFAIVILAPNMTVKLIAKVTLPSQGNNISDHATRPNMTRHIMFVDRTIGNVSNVRNWREARRTYRDARADAREQTNEGNVLASVGVTPQGSSYWLTDEALINQGFTPGTDMYNRIRAYSRSNDPNRIAIAHAAFHMRADSMEENILGLTVVRNSAANGGEGESMVIGDVWDRRHNRARQGMDPALANFVVGEELRNGAQHVKLVMPDGSGQNLQAVQDAVSAAVNGHNAGLPHQLWAEAEVINESPISFESSMRSRGRPGG